MFRASYVLAAIFITPPLGYALWKLPKGSDPLPHTIEVSECSKLIGEYKDLMAVSVAAPESTSQASLDFSNNVIIKYMEEKRGLSRKCNKFFKEHLPKPGPEQALFDEARRIEALALYYNISTK